MGDLASKMDTVLAALAQQTAASAAVHGARSGSFDMAPSRRRKKKTSSLLERGASAKLGHELVTPVSVKHDDMLMLLHA